MGVDVSVSAPANKVCKILKGATGRGLISTTVVMPSRHNCVKIPLMSVRLTFSVLQTVLQFYLDCGCAQLMAV